jgi:hypothetical protein
MRKHCFSPALLKRARLSTISILPRKQRHIEANGGCFEGIEDREDAIREALSVTNHNKFKCVLSLIFPATNNNNNNKQYCLSHHHVFVVALWDEFTLLEWCICSLTPATSVGVVLCRNELQLTVTTAALHNACSSTFNLATRPSMPSLGTPPAIPDDKICVICLELPATASFVHGSTVRGLDSAPAGLQHHSPVRGGTHTHVISRSG